MVRNYKAFRNFLRVEGYPNSMPQAQHDFLVSKGYSGSLPKMWFDFLGSLGYTEGSLQARMIAWEDDNFPGNSTGVISATVPPALQPINNSQTATNAWLASASNTSNYSSTGGSIVSAVREVRINGGAWTTTLSDNLFPNNTVEGRVRVTDSLSNIRIFPAGVVVVSAVAVTFSSAAAITGTPTVGSVLTVAATATGGVGAITLSRQWTRNGQPIVGQTATTYTTTASDDKRAIGCIVTGTDSEGTVGVSSAPTVNVLYTVPSGSGTIANAFLLFNTGNQTVNAAPAFTNATGGSWSISPSWALIDSDGLITLPTDTLREAEVVTITYTNSGGSANRTFTTTVRVSYATNPIPVTVYNLTTPTILASRFSLTVTVETQLVATGTGNFTLTVTSPAPYIGGPYSTDLSAEGGAGNLNFESITTAPQNFIKPTIARTVVSPGGSAFKIGDTFAATPGLWVYDNDDRFTISVVGQWYLNGSPISGATSLTFVATATGNLTYVETITGAGTTRTSVSTAITIVSVSRSVNVPVTTYSLTTPAPFTYKGIWDITAGDSSATVVGFPNVPTTPAWSITAGDSSATVVDYPGEI